MFLRHKICNKDGKRHRYWSVVESKRVAGGRVVQKHVLHLGEINDSQELAWRRSIEVVDEAADRPKTLSLFPEDRCEGLLPDASIVRLRLSQLRLCRPRQWGACWLALTLWEELQLDRFWAERLPASRKGTRWDRELFVLVAYRLLTPGSEWRLHRDWFERTALEDRGRAVPDAIKGNDDGQAFFGILEGTLARADGEPIGGDEIAEIALAIIGIIKAHHIVDVWANDIAQNKMRNAIDDYFFDVLRDERGIELPVEVMDDVELKIMDLARARFPG